MAEVDHGVQYPRGGSYSEACWRTVFCNTCWPGLKGLYAPKELPSIIDNRIHIPPVSKREEKQLVSLICELPTIHTAQLCRRTMMKTASGLLGIGPASTKPGDLVSVLMGGRRPIVLCQTNDTFRYDWNKSRMTYHRVIGKR